MWGSKACSVVVKTRRQYRIDSLFLNNHKNAVEDTRTQVSLDYNKDLLLGLGIESGYIITKLNSFCIIKMEYFY